MKIISLFVIISLFSGCVWWSRDYYYGAESPSERWSSEFIPGKGSDKNGTHPAEELFSYKVKGLKIQINSSYQDVAVFAPFYIPIPTPQKNKENIRFELVVVTDSEVTFDLDEIKLINLDTQQSFVPESRYKYVDNKRVQEKSRDVAFKKEGSMWLNFKVGVNELDNIKIKFGPFITINQIYLPPEITLKKVKGEIQFNQFTL